MKNKLFAAVLMLGLFAVVTSATSLEARERCHRHSHMGLSFGFSAPRPAQRVYVVEAPVVYRPARPIYYQEPVIVYNQPRYYEEYIVYPEPRPSSFFSFSWFR